MLVRRVPSDLQEAVFSVLSQEELASWMAQWKSSYYL
jgi:hypothetical protein